MNAILIKLNWTHADTNTIIEGVLNLEAVYMVIPHEVAAL